MGYTIYGLTHFFTFFILRPLIQYSILGSSLLTPGSFEYAPLHIFPHFSLQCSPRSGLLQKTKTKKIQHVRHHIFSISLHYFGILVVILSISLHYFDIWAQIRPEFLDATIEEIMKCDELVQVSRWMYQLTQFVEIKQHMGALA